MSVGVVVRPQLAPEQLEAVVRHVDEAGVPQLWLWEDCFLEGGLATAASALSWSSRVVVGIGLLPVPLRATLPSRRWSSPPSRGCTRAGSRPRWVTVCPSGWCRWAPRSSPR